ncbi:MAG: DUF4158 domain-containing protein [Acidobacteriota bacterium]
MKRVRYDPARQEKGRFFNTDPISLRESTLAEFRTRLKILNPNEIKELYSLPKLCEQEQEFYFSMDSQEQAIAYSHRSLISQTFFILQLGYFKAKKMIFTPNYEEIKEDINWITKRYFNTVSLPQHPSLSKTTRWHQQQRILSLYNYHDFDLLWKIKLQERARYSVRISSKPIFLFKDLLSYLEKSKVVLPSYSTIQEIISKALIEEKERLYLLAQTYITDDIDKALQELLTMDENRYLLTLVKKQPKDFNYKQVMQEINKQKFLKPLYNFAKGFLPHLGVSNDNIKYYASLVDYYSIFRLKRLGTGIVKIYLLCFVYYRYQRVNDNLVNTFIYLIRKYSEAVKIAAKERIYELKVESNQQLKNAGKVLNLFIDQTIADETEFGEVKKHAFSILEEKKFPLVVQ